MDVERIGVRITGDMSQLATICARAIATVQQTARQLISAQTQALTAQTNIAAAAVAAQARVTAAHVQGAAAVARAHQQAARDISTAAGQSASATSRAASQIAASQMRATNAVTNAVGQYAAAQQRAANATNRWNAAALQANGTLTQTQSLYATLGQLLQGTGQGLGGVGASSGRAVGGMLRLLGASNSLAMVLSQIPGIVNTVLPAMVALGAVLIGFKVARWGVAMAAEAETAQTAFGVFLGSAKKGTELAAELRTLAAKTPLSESEVFGATKLLLAFGVAQDEVNDTLRRLGDISSGIGQPLTEIADLYGRMRVQGRLFAVDINQLTNRGIPVIEGLAKKFGVTKEAVRDLVEQGKVSFTDLEAVIQNMTSVGGKFYGMMDALSKTLNGKLSTLYDTFAALGREIGEVFLPAVKYAVDVAISGLTMMTEWLRAAKTWWTENKDAIMAVGDALLYAAAGYAALRVAAAAYTAVQIAQLVGTRVVLMAIARSLMVMFSAVLMPILSAVFSLIVAAISALAVLTGPVIATVLVLVGLGYAAYKAWQWLFGKKIEPITISIKQDGNFDVAQLDKLASSEMGEKGMSALRRRFGTTNAGLRQMAIDGKLSGAAVTEALQQGAEVAGDFQVAIDEATGAITLQEGATEANMGANAQALRAAKAIEEEKKAMAEAEAKRQQEETERIEKINKLRREGAEAANEAIYQSTQELYGLMAGLDSEQMANLRTINDLKRKNHMTNNDAEVRNLTATLESSRLFKIVAAARKASIQEVQDAEKKAEKEREDIAEKRQKDAQAVVDAHKTSTEKFREEHQKLSDMLNLSEISVETYNRAMTKLQKDLEKDIVVEVKLDGVDALMADSIKVKDMLHNMRIGRLNLGPGTPAAIPGPLATAAPPPGPNGAAPPQIGGGAFGMLAGALSSVNQITAPVGGLPSAASMVANNPMVSVLQLIERNTRGSQNGPRLVPSSNVSGGTP